MKIGLFIPCYIDQFYPQVAIATLELLEKLGLEVGYPKNQTCCGQPMANAGFSHLSNICDNLLINNFKDFDYIVSPSGSCVLHIKSHLHHYDTILTSDRISNKIYELTEFLTDVLKVDTITSRFPYKVGIHQGCHGQRGLYLSQMSELVMPYYSKPEFLLKKVKDLELVTLNRPDECCGFGGTFCVTEESISVKMGKDRVADHTKQGVDYITSADMSCLMHLDGILRRQKSKVKIIHISEILNAK